MATGALSSLGIGSSVLTYDIIEKLRAADEKAKISPIDTRIEKNLTQQKDLVAITGFLNTLKSSASSISKGTLFEQRSVTSTGTSAALAASSGVKSQEISLEVHELASRDIYQTNKFASSNTSLGAISGDLDITINGNTYNIPTTASTTLSDLADAINDRTDGNVEARILNVGGTNPYRLIIQSSQTGENQAITFGGGADLLSGLGLDELGVGEINKDNKIATARDADFTFNGIPVSRTSNTIDDITMGISIDLNEKGITKFRITQNTDPLKEEVSRFVNAYNDLANNLSISLGFNSETGTAGTLQGVSQLVSAKSQLSRLLTFMDSDGRTLNSYGLSLNDNGLLEFNETTFLEKVKQDPSDVESFFKGMTTYSQTQYSATGPVSDGSITINSGDFKINGISFPLSLNGTASENTLLLRDTINLNLASEGVLASLNQDGTGIILTRADGGEIKIEGNEAVLTQLGFSAGAATGTSKSNEGLFAKLTDTLEGMLSKTNGSLTLLDQQFANNQKRLTLEKEKAVKQLDGKYATMVNQFASYDNMIAKLNNQFAALQSMIDAQLNTKN